MPSQTIAQRLIGGLLARGAVELKPTSRYRAFRLPAKLHPDRTYYVGKAGALRMSRSGRVTHTLNCSDEVRELLIHTKQ